jgi:hypothetical protein
MEKPNYRLNEIETTEASGRVVTSIGLRKSSTSVEDKTFFWLFGNPCRCEKDYSGYKCGRNITCDCVGYTPLSCGCDGNCEKFCECVGVCESDNQCIDYPCGVY